jgi:hypothetical protein
MTRPTLRNIPTDRLVDAVRSADLLDDRDRIGFAWRSIYVEATVAAIRAELQQRAVSPGRRLGVRGLLNVGGRSNRVRSA